MRNLFLVRFHALSIRGYNYRELPPLITDTVILLLASEQPYMCTTESTVNLGSSTTILLKPEIRKKVY
jgi:hypothetical protein